VHHSDKIFTLIDVSTSGAN